MLLCGQRLRSDALPEGSWPRVGPEALTIDLQSIADIKVLCESVDLEGNLAAGRNGKGALPRDFWRTYGAFANPGAASFYSA
jgi:hypothetical protein